MTNLDDLMKQAADLLKQGSELQLGNPKSKDLGNLNLDYQSWYTRALAHQSQVKVALLLSR